MAHSEIVLVRIYVFVEIWFSCKWKAGKLIARVNDCCCCSG